MCANFAQVDNKNVDVTDINIGNIKLCDCFFSYRKFYDI